MQEDYQTYPNNNKPGSGFSTAALICGIISLIMLISLIFSIFSIIPAVAGIILALISRSRLGRWQDTALGGFICSIISMVIFLFLLTIGIYIFHFTQSFDPGSYVEDYDHHYPSSPHHNNGDGDLL